MSRTALINDSTSVIQIDTSQYESGASTIVYISTTTNPGQFVTVRDATGYLSSPQYILLSTTGGARLNGSATASSILQQRFGFQSLIAQTGSNWISVNENPFKVPTAAYQVKTLATTDLNTNTFQATGLASTVKADTQALQARSTATMATLYPSTLYVNTYTQYLQSGPADFDTTLQGSLHVYASTASETGATRMRSNLSTAADFLVAGNISSAAGTVWLGGDLTSAANIAAPQGLLLSAKNVSTLTTGSLGTAVWISSLVTVGAVASTNKLFTRTADSRNFVVTSSIQFGAAGDPSYIHYHPGFLDFGVSTIFSTITTDHIDAGLTLSLNSMNFQAVSSSETVSSIVLGQASITNQYGSLNISTIRGNTLSTGILKAPFVSTVTNVTTGTIQFNTTEPSGTIDILYPPNTDLSEGKVVVENSWMISSIGNNGMLNVPNKGLYTSSVLLNDLRVHEIVAAKNTFSSMNVETLTIERALNFNTVSPNFTGPTPIEAPGASWYGPKNTQASTLTTGAFYANRIQANQTLQFGTKIETISSLILSSLQTTETVVSSLNSYSIRVGDPVEYSTINPSSSYLKVIADLGLGQPPYNFTTGLGTYFNKLIMKASDDFFFTAEIVNPSGQFVRDLPERYVDRICGTGQFFNGYTAETQHSRQQPVSELPCQLAVDTNNDAYFVTGNKLTYLTYTSPITFVYDTIIGEQGFQLNKIQDNRTQRGSGQWGGQIIHKAGRSNHYFGEGVQVSTAQFHRIMRLCGDGPSSFFINDNYNFALRHVSTNGIINTVLRGFLTNPYYGVTPNYNQPAIPQPTLPWGTGFTSLHEYGYQVGAGGPLLPFFVSTIVNDLVKGPDGKLYSLDNWNEVVHRIDISAQQMSRWYGKYHEFVVKGPVYDGVGSEINAVPFYLGKTHCFDTSGNYYFGDESWTLKKCDAPNYTITPYAGQRYTQPPGPGGSHQEYFGDGIPVNQSYISTPHALCCDSGNNIYFYDYGTERVRVVKANDQFIYDAAGTGTRGYSGDGGVGREAEIGVITTMVADSNNNIYMADMTNHIIRRLDFQTSTITTVVGTGTGGYSGDGGDALLAQLSTPTGLYLDPDGNLFIADGGNYMIRVYDTNSGNIYRFGGSPYTPYYGDGGPATEAILNRPVGMVMLNDNSIWISDTGNNVIRRIEPSNSTITTIVGTGTAGFNGDGPALATHLSSPGHLSFDYANSTMYFTDTANYRVRFYNMTTGQVSTLAGTGDFPYNGDGMSPAETNLNVPLGVLYDPSGSVYVGEVNNYIVRQIHLDSNVAQIFTGVGGPSYGPVGNPANACAIGSPTQLSFDTHHNVHVAMNHPAITNVTRINRSTGIFEQIMQNWGAAYNSGNPINNYKGVFSQQRCVGLTGATADNSNNIVFQQDTWGDLGRTYTVGTAIAPVYFNMNLEFRLGNLNTAGGANINGNPIASFNFTNPNPYYVNIANLPFNGDGNTFSVALFFAGGFSPLELTAWVTGIPNEGNTIDAVPKTGGITMKQGAIRWPNYLADFTIQNQFNDARMRNLIYNGSLQSSSDPALKEDISGANLALCYQTLAALPLRTYNYNQAYQSTFFQPSFQPRLGFLTTEVAPYFPKSVTTTPFEYAWGPSSIQMLDIAQIKYLHLGATQQLAQQVSTLETTATFLEETCSSLRAVATQRTASHS